MGALYLLSGVMTGVAATMLSMGGDGRISILFVASLGLVMGAAIWEAHQ